MSWKRWPCPFCQHQGRFFRLLCPQCQALPWGPSEVRRDATRPALPYEAGKAGLLLPADTELTIKGSGLFRLQQRFSTPSGFLGVLTRKMLGRAHWLGTDGHEWTIGPGGQISRVSLLFDGDAPIAAAQAEPFRGGYRLWQGTARFRFEREGLFRQSYTLSDDAGDPVLRIRTGFFSSEKAVEVLRPVPLASVVLSVYFLYRMKQTEA